MFGDRRKYNVCFVTLKAVGANGEVPGTDELDGPALLLLDLDLKNAFPTFEWDAIREAVLEMVPSLAAWTSWCHQAPADVLLPSGERVQVDRGAEQGDPLGSLYCGVTLAMAVSNSATALIRSVMSSVSLATKASN